MKKLYIIIIVSLLFSLESCNDSKNSERQPYAEELNPISRGLVVFHKDGQNILAWRKLPNEQANYIVWRKYNKGNQVFIDSLVSLQTTHFLDKDLVGGNPSYQITLKNEKPIDSFTSVLKNSTIFNNYPALEFDVQMDYKQAQITSGDLDGDGEREIIIIHSKMKHVDPVPEGWIESSDKMYVSAFKMNGELIWNFDLGWGIEAGPAFAPLVVWDINADGKSEVLLKTNKNDNPKNYDREYLTILNGENGKILNETRWPAPVSGNYNSDSRNFIAVAHLDGINPNIIVARGIYRKQIIEAFDSELNILWSRTIGDDIESRFENKILQKIWRKFSDDKYRGSHSLPIADVDENGSEEILWGEHCITENGDDLWKVEDKMPYTGHPDIVYAADILPERPGKEVYYCREGWLHERDNIGMLLVDDKGETIWSNWNYTHVDGGWGAKIIPSDTTWKFFAYDIKKKIWKPGERSFKNTEQLVMDDKGKIFMTPDSSWIRSFPVDWEGDGTKEICKEGGQLIRYNGEEIVDFGEGVYWGGDIFGDHREELAIAPKNKKIYIVFNDDEIDSVPRITKQADRQYKNDLSRTAMQFNVIPTESGYIPAHHIVENK